jgi:hypothetical protein
MKDSPKKKKLCEPNQAPQLEGSETSRKKEADAAAEMLLASGQD